MRRWELGDGYFQEFPEDPPRVLSDDEVAEIERWYASSTPGTWYAADEQHYWQLFAAGASYDLVGPNDERTPMSLIDLQLIKAAKKDTPYAEYWPGQGDSDFIVEAHNAMPHLLHTIRTLRRQNEQLRIMLPFNVPPTDDVNAVTRVIDWEIGTREREHGKIHPADRILEYVCEENPRVAGAVVMCLYERYMREVKHHELISLLHACRGVAIPLRHVVEAMITVMIRSRDAILCDAALDALQWYRDQWAIDVIESFLADGDVTPGWLNRFAKTLYQEFRDEQAQTQ